MRTMRVLLADDHELVRAGVRSLLVNLSGVEVVGEAGDGLRAVELAQQLKPDIVLMDIMMPGLNGLEATARIVKELPQTKVVILSMNATEEYVLQALRAGATGYLLKNISPPELELAVNAVAKGETYLTSAVSKHVIENYVRRVGPPTTSLERLTPRQREVLQLIAEGNRTKEIAKRLKISAKTVEMHRTQIMDALDIHDIAGLVRYAIRMGIITPEV